MSLLFAASSVLCLVYGLLSRVSCVLCALCFVTSAVLVSCVSCVQCDMLCCVVLCGKCDVWGVRCAVDGALCALRLMLGKVSFVLHAASSNQGDDRESESIIDASIYCNSKSQGAYCRASADT